MKSAAGFSGEESKVETRLLEGRFLNRGVERSSGAPENRFLGIVTTKSETGLLRGEFHRRGGVKYKDKRPQRLAFSREE